MKSKLILLTACFETLIILITCIIYFCAPVNDYESKKSDQLVTLNEINNLVESGNADSARNKINELENSIRDSGVIEEKNVQILFIGGLCVFFILAVSLYFYFAVIKPFDKLKDFADRISKGNFDVPLEYERSNYFGKFTWAFDCMRSEIVKSRQCEKEAVENNKTVIATLSHDIKTPIASIRAYAEGLQANMDSTPEKRDRFLSVIMRKCDEVSKLTNDLFLHSISDLDKMKVNSESFEICSFTLSAVSEIAGENHDIKIEKPDFEAFVYADKNRLTQIIENLINNSRKYAKTNIDIKLTKKDGYVNIHFTDYGKGIPDSDMPFIFGKFYRGKNVGNEQGSGLGLYIVKYLSEKMNGNIFLHNHIDSFEAIVSLPIK